MPEKQLTIDDLADYTITWSMPDVLPARVTAAYANVDGPYVAFKDHQHRVVAMARTDTLAFIKRED